MDKKELAIATLGSLEALHAYSAFLPSIMTIRKFVDDEEAIHAIRQGEFIATGFTIILGWVLSELTDSYLPLVMTAAAAVVYLSVYEFALRGKLDGEGLKTAGGIAALTIIPGIPPFP